MSRKAHQQQARKGGKGQTFGNNTFKHAQQSQPECSHIDEGYVNLQNCRKFFQALKDGKFKPACQECAKLTEKKKKKSNIKPTTNGDFFICLQCGTGIFCDSHAREHADSMAKHPLCTQIKTFRLCCFRCHKTGLQYESVAIKQGIDLIKGIDVVNQAPPDKQVIVSSKPVNQYVAQKGGKGKGPALAIVPGVKGLDNLGNTCFFNSIMQSIVQTFPLLNHFTPQLVDPRRPSVKMAEGPLASEMRNFFAEYWSVNRTPSNRASPRPLFMQIIKRAKQFASFRQQDAQELLRCLLDQLITEETNTIKRAAELKGSLEKQYALEIEKIIQANSSEDPLEAALKASLEDVKLPEERDDKENQENVNPTETKPKPAAAMFDSITMKLDEMTREGGVPGQHTDILADLSRRLELIENFEKGIARDRSIESIFQGNFVSTVQCHSCGIQSHVYESFFDISLSIPYKFLPQKQRDQIMGPKKTNPKPPQQPQGPSKKALKRARQEAARKLEEEQKAKAEADAKAAEGGTKPEIEPSIEGSEATPIHDIAETADVALTLGSEATPIHDVAEPTNSESEPKDASTDELKSNEGSQIQKDAQVNITDTTQISEHQPGETKSESTTQEPQENHAPEAPKAEERTQTPAEGHTQPLVETGPVTQAPVDPQFIPLVGSREAHTCLEIEGEAPILLNENGEPIEFMQPSSEFIEPPPVDPDMVYSTPLSEIDAKADQSFITVEEDEEVLSEQEMKKRIATYQSELLEMILANLSSKTANAPLIEAPVVTSSTSRCSIYDCLAQFIAPEDLYLDEGNGVDCYPCTRQAFNQSNLPVEYLIEHYPKPELDLQKQVELLQGEGLQVNPAFYSISGIDNSPPGFLNRSIKPRLVKRTARKQLMVEQFPEILTVHFKRFIITAYDIQKISVSVEFPVELDLTPYAKKKMGEEPVTYTYELYGVCNHSGGFGSGHYTAFTRITDFKDETKSNWYYFSDTQYHPVDIKQVLNSEPYILFYRRVYR